MIALGGGKTRPMIALCFAGGLLSAAPDQSGLPTRSANRAFQVYQKHMVLVCEKPIEKRAKTASFNGC